MASDLIARQTIRDKCEFVRLSVREYEGNSLQLHQFLGLLPQHIFGLDSSRSNWFAEACGKQDIEALCQLLSPNSDLFAHLLKSVDDNRKVAVPVSLLPPSVQKGIKANDPTIASPFFQSKIPSHVQGAAISTIPLNLFEFYMVSFAFLATRGIQARGKAQPDDRGRMSTYLPRFSAEPEKAAGASQEQQQLYQRLFGQYLQMCFPSSSAVVPHSAPPSPAGVRTHSALLASPSPGLRDTSPGPHTQQNRGRRVAKSFLHTFIEMWLPHNNDSGERQPTSPMLAGMHALVRHLVSAAVEASTSLPPLLVHSAGGTPYGAGTPTRTPYTSPYAYRDRSPGGAGAGAYERNTAAEAPVTMTESLQLLQKPLWRFLDASISRWSGGGPPFSWVVEIWLAYVQPPGMVPTQSAQDFAKKWRAYVFANLGFFSHLAYRLLTSKYLDFLAVADLRQYEKVVATLSNGQLMSVIKEGEETIVRLQQNIFAPSSQAQQLEQRLRQHCAMICKQLADYSPVFYRPADSTQGDRDTVIATLTSLADASEEVVEVVPPTGQGDTEKPAGETDLKTRILKLVEQLKLIFEVETLPQPPKSHLATPRPRTRRVFAARKWSPLDVRFMPRGIGNNLEEAIPPPVSSHEFAPLVQFLYALHCRYLKGSPIGGDHGILPISRLRTLATPVGVLVFCFLCMLFVLSFWLA